MNPVLWKFVAAIISILLELAIKYIVRQFRYIFCYSGNLETLRKGVEELKLTKSRVDALVVAATTIENTIREDVEVWRNEVTQLNEHMESLFNRPVQSLDLKSRVRMSKTAYEMFNRVDRLQAEGEKFTEDNVSYLASPSYSAMFSGDAVPLGSRDSIMEEILEALKKDDVKVLGLYGMGGVGKTTLIREVAKLAEEMKLFDVILMAVVSQDSKIRNIQDQFASQLKFRLGVDEESDAVWAGRLHKKLEKTGKVLVILDDLWKHLDLQDVGIPSPDKHKCCKIIITTREKDACAQMDCKNNTFSVNALSEKEGWHLFEKMAGDCVTSAEVRPVAIEVAKECGGLPLAIVVVARALKGKNFTRWNDALSQLRASVPRNIKGMHKDVYSRLQLSYDYLDGEEIKHFFLLFSLFPEDSNISIERSMRYGMGLGLFHLAGLVVTIQDARRKVDSFVDILKSACLLLDGDKEGTARVHDVVRDFCLSSIASKEQLHNLNVYHQSHVFLVKSGSELTEWSEIDCSAEYTAISLVNNDIEQFPRGLDYSKLKFLLFSGYAQEVNIADSFFETMKELKVLDISYVHIPLFPPSQGLLGKLRTLCLDHCTLEEMEIIVNLERLEVLSLSGSRFKDDMLPMRISQLTRLRLLDLSKCSDLLIPCGILSNLSRLEELYLDNSFDKWEEETEEESYTENSGRRARYANVSELKSSSHSLTTLMGMHVKDVTLFPKDLFFPKLTTFRIQIGDDLFDDENYSLSNAGLKVDFTGSSIAKDHGICSLMKRCDYLHLSRVGNMKSIPCDINRDLEVLVVEKSSGIEEIIISEEGVAVLPKLKCLWLSCLPKLASFCNVRQSRKPKQSQSLFTDKVVFPSLVELKLQKLDEVEYIWPSELRNQSFLQLKALTVSYCNSLKSFFQPSIAKRLEDPEELEVKSCEEMKDIVGEKGEEETEKVIVFPLQLEELTVSYCNSLKSLFQPSIAKRLENLEELEVKSCEEMKDIVGEEGEEETEKAIVFPKVKSLLLHELPKLTSFRKGDFQLKCQKCQNEASKNSGAEAETIPPTSENNFGCPYFQPLFNHKVVFPSLEALTLKKLDKAENIWHSELPIHSFLQLKVLTVSGCNSLTSLFQPSIAKRLVNLKELKLKSCKEMKEIVREEEEEETEEVIVFPKVKRLLLRELPKLTGFRKGNYQLKWPKCQNAASKNCGGGTETIAPTSQNNFGCPYFQPLFNHKVAFPSLGLILLNGLKGIKQIWRSQFPTESFPKLMGLLVKRCDALEAVIGKQGGEEEGEGEVISTGNLVIPQLRVLMLQNLQNIRCFCEDNSYTLECPSLEAMALIKCPKMTTFSYASTTTPRLKKIYTAEYAKEYIPMDKDINTTVKYIFFQQVKGQPNSSTSKEEEGEEKDEIERDGAGCSKSYASTSEEEEGFIELAIKSSECTTSICSICSIS